MVLRHALPGTGVTVLERQSLGIRAIAQDYRITSFGDGQEQVGAQHEAVVHLDRYIPVDPHAVADFAATFR